MKKIVLFLGLISIVLISQLSSAQTVDVTFRVDMQDTVVSENGVHIAGGFPAPYPLWSPNGILLDTPVIGSVYTTTLQLTANSTVEFKYVNGMAWGDDEGVPVQCALNNNRFVEIGNNDTILPVVCFASCLPCVLPDREITFQVDMSNETVDPAGVFIGGSFNGWSSTATPMIDMGSGVYAVTLTLGEGEYHQYKFLNGNVWGVSDESVPPTCATDNNREYTVPAYDETIPVVCFGSCDPCTTVVDVNVTFQVDMSEQIVSDSGVHIAGSFQGWVPGGTLMNDQGNGIWSYSFVLQSGSYHQYKFLNGDAWGTDEGVPSGCAQNNNRYLTVPQNDTVLIAVCFGSCVICAPPMFDVTFSVDMSTQIVSDSGVHIAGSFQGWNPGANEMTHVGNKLYEITLPVGEGQLHEYKFVNGNDWPQAEFVPGECSNFDGNREFVGPSMNTEVPTVCFGECSECTTTLYNFNFTVMLEGAFNGADMNTTLFDEGFLPIDQPFNTAPWNYDGLETLIAPTDADIVDWLYIQFRETSGDASTAISDSLLDHQAAVLLSDGTIARPDGSPFIYYNGNITKDLYVVIYHRNHLSVMSATPVVGFSNSYFHNFTDGLSKAYLDGQKALDGGMFGMIAGDSDANGTVNMDDKDINWKNEAGNAGYYPSDLNMDSQVNNLDKTETWEPNIDSETKVPN